MLFKLRMCQYKIIEVGNLIDIYYLLIFHRLNALTIEPSLIANIFKLNNMEIINVN